MRLGEEKVSLDHLDLVLLTHLHIDHACELPGILKARALANRAPIDFEIFGPTGSGLFPSTTHFVDLLFGGRASFDCSRFCGPDDNPRNGRRCRNRRAAAPKTLLEKNGLKISAIAGHHDDAPAIIYRVEYKGRSVVFSGDIDAIGLADLRLIASHCNLLVFNTAVLDPPHSRPILYRLHSPPKAIGEVAAAAHVGALLLTHLNPSIDAAHEAVRSSIRHNYDGPVTFSKDRMHVTP